MMRFIDRADEAIAGLMLFACFAIVCVEVISRSYLGIAISWSEELSRYLIIVSTYFGAAAVRSRDHIRVELLIDFLPPKARRLLEMVVTLACALYCATVAVAACQWVGDTVNLGLVSAESSLVIPIWVFQLSVPIGFGIMALRFLAQAYMLVRGHAPVQPLAEAPLPNH